MKYQLTILADTLGELQSIVAVLPPQVGGTATPATVAAGVAPSVPSLIPPTLTPALEEEDEDEDLPAVFNTPNVPPATPATAVSSLVQTPAATVASPTPAGAVELDPRGYPWDVRIHASTKTRMKSDNTWKKAKGTDPTVVEQVEAELRGRGYGVPGPALPAPVTTSAPALPAATPAALPVPGILAPSNEPAVHLKNQLMKGLPAGLWTAPQLKSIINAAGIEQANDIGKYAGDFAALSAAVAVIERLQSLVKSERVNADWVQQVAGAFGFSDVFSITGNLPVVPQIVEYLDSSGL